MFVCVHVHGKENSDENKERVTLNYHSFPFNIHCSGAKFGRRSLDAN